MAHVIVILDTFCIELSWHYSHPVIEGAVDSHVVMIGRHVLGWRAGAVYDQSLASHKHHRKHMRQCWSGVGPPSTTLAQYYANIISMSRAPDMHTVPIKHKILTQRCFIDGPASTTMTKH